MSKISLKAARINAGYTLRQVGEQTGLHINTLSDYEKGKSMPRWDTFVKLCSLYQIPISDVFIPEQ